MMKKLKMMLTLVTVVASYAASADETWSAVWTKANAAAAHVWNTTDYWQNGPVGGLNASDTINFAYPFTPFSSTFHGQGIDMAVGIINIS